MVEIGNEISENLSDQASPNQNHCEILQNYFFDTPRHTEPDYGAI